MPEKKTKFNKVPLSEGKMTGGLKDLIQVYKFNFLPEEQGYCAKIELAIMLQRDKLSQGAYRSLRIKNMAELKGFIANAIKSYVFFGKMLGEINPNNFQYKMNQIKIFVDDCFRADLERLKEIRI